MNNMVKQLLIKILLCLFLLSTLTGCWNARELNELSIVAGIGIDKTEEPGNVLLTAQIVKPGEIIKTSKDGPGGGGTAFWNLKNSSRTVFDTFREYTHETGNKLYLSHTQAIILGTDAAEDGVRKYFDFFLRSHETRPTTMILVSRGTAWEVLDIMPEAEKLPAIYMAKLSKAQDLLTSHALPVNLQEFTARLLSKTTSPIAPIVTVSGEDTKKKLHIEGMAVFREDKLAGTLSAIETRGLLWVTGKVKGGAIDVDLPDGKATLEITKAESEIVPAIKEGKPYVHVKIVEAANLVSQTSRENLATVSGFSSLEQRQSDVIRGEILAALKKAKDLNTDIFGFGDKFHKKYREEWKIMEDDWGKIFPELQVDLEIKSNIKAAGLIIKPAAPDTASGKE